jgi:hypothetical protein
VAAKLAEEVYGGAQRLVEHKEMRYVYNVRDGCSCAVVLDLGLSLKSRYKKKFSFQNPRSYLT